MPFPLSLDLQQKPNQTLKQLQRLIMSRQMQQAIHLLQMPVMELAPAIETELEQNPVLEYAQESEDSEKDTENELIEEDNREAELDIENPAESSLRFDDRDLEILKRLDDDFRDHFSESGNSFHQRSTEQDKLQNFLESSIEAKVTPFEYLVRQAQESFDNRKELALAEVLIGSLNESGFLASPLEEIAMLENCSVKTLEKILITIQSFDPPGIGARNLQESLLIQLRRQNKEKTLAYKIIDQHFDDLLHNRIPVIKKGLHCSAEEIGEMIDCHIAKLDLHPAAQLTQRPIIFTVPDISLKEDGESLQVVINEESMPRLRLNANYMRMLDDETLTADTKEFIRQKVASAKWLLRNILQRNDTLEKIALILAKRQREFFLNPQGCLTPLTMKTLAEELGMHESTIARAVANKYIDTPRGLYPLRFFFTNALSTQEGKEVSTRTVQELLKEIISNEDKAHPLSDESISRLIKDKGIQCARRTVTKYRTALNIGSAQQRRKFQSNPPHTGPSK